MAEINLTYERRDGIDADHGIDFEWQTTNLAYLRCEKLHRQWVQDNTLGVKSYFVANNVDGIGAFDDVVIRTEYPHHNEDKTKLVFVQCKYFSNPKKCLLEYLFKCATVQKYFDSFIGVLRILNDHRALSCQTYNEINIRKKTKRQSTQEIDANTEKEQKLRNLFQCKPQDCEFVLYSNMILNAGFENMETQQDNDIAKEILNTAGSSEFNIFLNAAQLEYLPNEQFVDAREIFEELKQEFGKKFRIIVNQVARVNLDVLKSIIPSADIRGIFPLLEEEVKYMFQNKPCTAITQNSELLENIDFFCQLITKAKNELESFLRIPEHERLFSNETIEYLQKQLKNETQLKIFTSSIELEKLKLKQYVSNEVQESRLIFFIKDEDDFSIWINARNSRLYRNLNQIIVCFEDSNKFSDYDIDANEVLIEIYHKSDIKPSYFAQFSDETSKSILNHAISFQGVTVTVNDFCGDEWRRQFDEETICRILRREEIKIGSKFFDSLDCYMERKLQLKEIHNKNFYTDNQTQIWDKSGKSDNKTLTENDIIVVENKEVFLLTGPSGIGKSTTLKSLALKYKNKYPKYFVYLIDLNKYLNVLKKYEEDCDVSGAIEFLAQKILNLQQPEYQLFVYACAEKKNVALFFDAFDEISPDGEKKFSTFLGTISKAHAYNIFVSSRPNFIGTLEENLKQDSLILLPFTSEDIICFFLKYYEKLTNKNATKIDKEEMENKIVQIIKENGNFVELFSIPLQISMLAEIHFEKISKMTTGEKMSFTFMMDICSLYNAFITKHVERYLLEKKKLILQDEEMIIAIHDEMRDAEELACKLIFPDINQTSLTEYSAAIVKMCHHVGLITNINPPVFLHRTYGEFLAASFFVKCIMNETKNTSSYVSFMCKNVLMQYKYREIRKFINAILCNLNFGENDSQLINHNIKILVDWEAGETSLHIAAKEKQAEIVKLLVQNNPSKLNETDIKGYTAVEYACRSGCVKSVEILGLNNCLKNIRNEHDDNVLHFAAKGNSIDIIHMILGKFPTILRKKNRYGSTAFNVACRYNNTEAAMCLLQFDRGLVDIADEKGNLPIHYATEKGNIQIVKEILCHNNNLIGSKGNDGLFPLHIACKYNHIEIAKYLLAQKNNLVNVECGEKKETPLHFAAKYGNIEQMKLLLHYDPALLNKCNSDGESPLLCALLEKQTAAANFLLKLTNCAVNTGENPLNFAARNGDIELMMLLLDRDQSLLSKCNLNGESPLLSALIKTQSAAAKFLLTFPNCLVNSGENPLNLAAILGEVDILRKLYSLDCTLLNKVGENSSRGHTPLLCALKSSNFEAATYLLELPDCLLTVDLDGKSPFHYAAMNGYIEILTLLINKDRLLLLKRDKIGRSALYFAINQGQTEVVRTLLSCDEYFVEGNILQNELESGIKTKNFEIMTMMLKRDSTLINMENIQELLPLDIACECNNIEAVKYLLPRTDSALILDRKLNQFILHLAAVNGNLNMMQLILEKFPTLLNQRDFCGRTALHYACKSNNTEMAKILLNHDKCQIDVYDDELQNPLHLASQHCNIEVMKLILEIDIKLLNKQNKFGQSPLHLILNQHQSDSFVSDAAEYLLNLNCLVNKELVDGINPIHLASKKNEIKIIKLIIERDEALLNLQDGRGLSPLHHACKCRSNETVSFLLNLPECDINLTDNEGNTPLHHAAMDMHENNSVTIMSLLIQRDRSLLNKRNKMDQTALHLAATHSNANALEYLLDQVECKANVQDKYGDTPLHSFIKGNNDFFFTDFFRGTSKEKKILLFAKLDSSLLNIKNNYGQTPLHIAVEKNESCFVDFLVRSKADVHMKDNDSLTPLDLALKIRTTSVKSLDQSIIEILQNN